MKRIDWRALVGILLVVVGALLLLQTFGVLRIVVSIVWTVVFLAAGAGFLVVFLGETQHWWAVIPGMALVGIGALIGLSVVGLDEYVGGAVFLGALSLAFWLVYLRQRQHWWAIIPGGILLTLAGVAALDQIAPWFETGGLLLLGMAFTFVLLYLLPTGGERMRWPLIPGGVLFLIGVIIILANSAVLRFVLPAAVVVVGAYLVFRALRSQ